MRMWGKTRLTSCGVCALLPAFPDFGTLEQKPSLGVRHQMSLYFFDTRDGETFVRDDEGLEFDGIERARDEATRGLADMARFAIPGKLRRELAVEVSDAARSPLLRASLWFEVQVLRT